MTARFTLPRRHWPESATVDDEGVLDVRSADPLVGDVTVTGGRR
jgi:hypothetical protein